MAGAVSAPGPIRVEVPPVAGRSYGIVIERGGLARLGELCEAAVPAHAWAVISDSRVAELYAADALASLRATGRRAEAFAFAAGEWNKTRSSWAELTEALLETGFGRDAAIVALGGGVTGDLAGFLAATFMRGVPVIQVPTTLLAMVDSSVGGKTGIDGSAAKNAIGAFHHPSLVLIDPELLATLVPFQRIAGLAEPVKMAAMQDASLFAWIEEEADSLRDGDPEALTALIERSVRCKADVVSRDPDERGVRAILNFGHTIGHALESLSGFSLLHGEAVALGMRLEARLGEGAGLTEAGTARRLDAVLARCGLPPEPEPDLAPGQILDAARSDKKSREGELRWALPARIGAPARASDGSWTHRLDDGLCARELAAALRSASEVPDSPA